MQQTNATIKIDAARLNRPLRTIYARVGASFIARLSGIPEDCTAARIRLYAAQGGAFADYPSALSPDGAFVRFPPAAFPSAAQTHYAVIATDRAGDDTYLGGGLVDVKTQTEV